MKYEDIEVGGEYWSHRTTNLKGNNMNNFCEPLKWEITYKSNGIVSSTFLVGNRMSDKFYFNCEDLCLTKKESYNRMIEDNLKIVENHYDLAKYYEKEVETLRKLYEECGE